jgi:hypothetical protein
MYFEAIHDQEDYKVLYKRYTFEEKCSDLFGKVI